MAAKKAQKSSKHSLSRSAFIRKYPNLPAPKLIELAKKSGIELTDNHIYVTRSHDRAKARAAAGQEDDYEAFWDVIHPVRVTGYMEPPRNVTGKARVTPEGKAKTATPDSNQGEQSIEQRILAIILEVGAPRAAKLFHETLLRVRALTKKRPGQ